MSRWDLQQLQTFAYDVSLRDVRLTSRVLDASVSHVEIIESTWTHQI